MKVPEIEYAGTFGAHPIVDATKWHEFASRINERLWNCIGTQHYPSLSGWMAAELFGMQHNLIKQPADQTKMYNWLSTLSPEQLVLLDSIIEKREV